MMPPLHVERGAETWSFEREREFCVPHQIALPPISHANLPLALGLIAERFTAEETHVLRVERMCEGGGLRAARLDLRTMRWRAIGEETGGVGVLELAVWLGRRTLWGANCALHAALLATRGKV